MRLQFNIKGKLVAIILITTGISLLLGFTFILVNERDLLRQEMLHSMSTIAQVTGNNLITELAFNDPRSAEETLERLREIPGIRNAYLFDDKNRFFAGFDRQPEDRQKPPDVTAARSEFDGPHLFIFHPVVFRNRTYGTIYLRCSTEDLNRRITQNVLAILAILGGVFLVSVVLTLKLQGYISQPILDLTNVARQVSQEGNYEVRAAKRRHDELGLLIDCFNDMLGQIHRRKLERDGVEAALQRAQSFLQSVIESMPSPLITAGQDGRVTQLNHAAGKIMGLPKEEVIGRSLEDLPFFGKYAKLAGQAFESGHLQEYYKDSVEEGDERHYINVSAYPLQAGDFRGVVMRLDDVTEVERKEQQLRQAQKMETIGTLAGGLAHDFNNVLGGVVGTASLLLYSLAHKGMPDKEELVSSLKIIDESAKRAADMVQQLLTLSKKQEVSLAPVDLNLALEHVVKICRNTFDKSIEITVQPPSGRAMVQADPTQLEQVILNLCVNAEHAMTIMRGSGDSWGGSLILSLEHVLADQAFCRHHLEAKEGHAYWLLSVNDTGVGIESKNLAKIFDPFFTTKQHGTGTGLGLAMVYSIIQQYRGFIDVYSEIGNGSRFCLYLPVLSSAGNEVAETSYFQEIPRGEGLLLVVDDEPVIRQIAGSIMEQCGYEVIFAENGSQGIEIFKERHREIRMVLLDMLMPQKSGKETIIELKKIDPQVKVLLTSGFRKDSRVEEVLQLGGHHFIQKPYTMRSLALAIRQVLEDNLPASPDC